MAEFGFYLMSLMVGLMVWMVTSLMISIVGLSGKDVSKRLLLVLSFVLGVPSLIFLIIFPPQAILLFELAMVLIGLSLGYWTGCKAARKDWRERIARAEAVGQWGATNFARLDQNGDQLLCTLDLARFVASADSTPEDRQMAGKISSLFADIGHPAVSETVKAGNALPTRPVVISKEDFQTYLDRKKVLAKSWDL